MSINEIAKAAMEGMTAGAENSPKKFEIPNQQDATDKTTNRPEKFDAPEIKNKLGDIQPVQEIKPLLPINNGEWSGEPGNSLWKPDPDYIPPEKSPNPEKPYSNPENKTCGEILEKYDMKEGIPFKDGEPDFSKISKGDVKIEQFSAERPDNFDKADIELAKQRDCTPDEVAKWRKENGYVWHECKDMKTMQLVPHEVHANVPHSGGIAEAKKGSGA